MQDVTLNNDPQKKKFQLNYEKQKFIWSIVFLLPWLAGLVILFLIPFFTSLRYSFFKLTPQAGAILEEFVGFKNYIWALNEHAANGTSFKVEMINTITDVAINLPVLLIFSLFIAVLLNMDFKGRGLVRAIFFIPVILNSVAVANALGGGEAISEIMAQQGIGQIFDLSNFLIVNVGLPEAAVGLVVGLIDRIYDILALSGVPILLFLASIQSIPSHLYEAAKIEGATGYETFWLITLPNVTPHILTVLIYALVDTFLTSPVSTIISDQLNIQQWGYSSAMSWMYVLAIIFILGVIALIFKVFKIGGSHYER